MPVQSQRGSSVDSWPSIATWTFWVSSMPAGIATVDVVGEKSIVHGRSLAAAVVTVRALPLSAMTVVGNFGQLERGSKA